MVDGWPLIAGLVFQSVSTCPWERQPMWVYKKLWTKSQTKSKEIHHSGLRLFFSINTTIQKQYLLQTTICLREHHCIINRQYMHNANVTFQQVIWCLSSYQMVTSSITSLSPSGTVCVWVWSERHQHTHLHKQTHAGWGFDAAADGV